MATTGFDQEVDAFDAVLVGLSTSQSVQRDSVWQTIAPVWSVPLAQAGTIVVGGFAAHRRPSSHRAGMSIVATYNGTADAESPHVTP